MFQSIEAARCTVIVLVLYPAFSNTLCPEECICTKEKASCVNKNMTYIPKFPQTIKILNFTMNRLPIVSKGTFLNLSHVHLLELFLVKCSIQKFEEGSFSNLKHLLLLDITGNNLGYNGLKTGLTSLKDTNITKLFARLININTTSSLFSPIYHSKLGVLDLSHNFITFLNGSDFSGLNLLKNLNVSYNKIKTLNFKGLENVVHLNLRVNKIEEVPVFCPGQFKNKLVMLDISHNLIYSFNQSSFNGGCLFALKSLNISENIANFMPNNLIADLPSLEILYVEWLSSNNIKFSPFTLNSSSLRELYMSNHIEHFFHKTDYKNIFKLCPNLRVLCMTDIKFNENIRGGKSLLEMLSPLTKLERLTLTHSWLGILPNNLLAKMTNLTHIDLSYNEISNWDNNFFEGLNKLRFINLAFNQIYLINKTSFPLNILKHLERLDLYGNPFSCNCDAFWFRNFIKTHNTSFLQNLYDRYICSSPLKWQGKPFFKFYPSILQCLSSLELTLIGLGSGMILLIAVFVIIYNFRWHLKYLIYMRRARKNYQALPADGQHYCYDAFVAYNAEDKIWVISELILFLEKQNGYKLCLHDRDFVIGKLIVDNICEENQKSRKTILVLSNNFAKSHWCQLEMTLAHARHLSENHNHLIVILLESINCKYLTNALKVLLSSATYIEWCQNDTENRMFWECLLRAMNE